MSRAVVEVGADASKVGPTVQRELDKAFANVSMAKAKELFDKVADIAKSALGVVSDEADETGTRIGRGFQAGGATAQRGLHELGRAAAAQFGSIAAQARAASAAVANSALVAGGVGQSAARTSSAVVAGQVAMASFGRQATSSLNQARAACDALLRSAQRVVAVFSGLSVPRAQMERFRATVDSVGRSVNQISSARILAIGGSFQTAGDTGRRSLQDLARGAAVEFGNVVSRSASAAAGITTHIGGALRGLAGTASNALGNLASEVGSKIGGLASTVVAGMRTVGLATVVGLGAAAAAAATLGIRTAAANETSAISFEVLLGSATKAQSFMARLQDFAAATPFDLPTLRSAASGFLTVGINAERIIPLLTRIGDATAAMNTGAVGVDRATYALKQMALAGKATKEDLNQLSDAGVPILDALSAHLGTTVVQLLDMISDGKVSAEDVFQSIEEGAGSSMQRISGIMARQSTTLEGIWSSFKDNASQALAKFAEPMIPSIKKAVDFAAVNVPKVLDFFMDTARRISAIFADSPVPEEYMNALKTVAEKIMPAVREGVEHLIKVVEENREGLEKFGRFMAEVVIPVMGKVILYLIDFTFWLAEVGVRIVATVVPAVRFFAEALIGYFGQILHGADSAFGWIPVIGGPLHAARAKFDEFADGVISALDRIDGKTVDVWVNTHERGSKGEHGGSGVGDGSTRITGMAVGGVTTREGLVNIHPQELVLPLESRRTSDLLARAIEDSNAGLRSVGIPTGTATPQFDVRVYIGDTELTDMVDVRISERNRDLKTRVRTGTGRRR